MNLVATVHPVSEQKINCRPNFCFGPSINVEAAQSCFERKNFDFILTTIDDLFQLNRGLDLRMHQPWSARAMGSKVASHSSCLTS